MSINVDGFSFRREKTRKITHTLSFMSRAEKTANLAGVIVPFAGVLAAVVLLWSSWVDAIDLGLLAGFYLLTAAGVTVGFHRLLTHRSFQTQPWLERTLAVL